MHPNTETKEHEGISKSYELVYNYEPNYIMLIKDFKSSRKRNIENRHILGFKVIVKVH